MKRILPILAIFVFAVGGCGVKASPIPPDVLVPKPISDMEGKVREGSLYLSWSLPKENMDDSKPPDLVAFRVLRREERGGCIECPGKFVIRAELDMRVPRGYYLGKGTVTWMDEELRDGTIYIYKIIGINHWDYPSSPSNEVIIHWGAPPQPPLSLKGEERYGSILLTWIATAETSGYNIYRRQEGSPFSPDPLNTTPVQADHYTDTDIQGDRTYFYIIRGVRYFAETPVEGKSSDEIKVTPQ